MVFFKGKEVNAYTREAQEKMKIEISAFKDNEIMSCNFDEWGEYFSSKYYLEPIVIYEENIDQTIKETKVKTRNQWVTRNSFETEYYLVDGFCITYTIPFYGNAELLKLKPSTFIFANFEVASLNKPNDNSCSSFKLDFLFSRQELIKETDVKSFVEKKFQGEFKEFRKMIEYVNSDVDPYNKNIKSNAVKFLEERRKKAAEYAMLTQTLHIPLQLDISAPNIAPLPLKRIVREPILKPIEAKIPVEYCISDEDYKNIVNIIHNTCSSMEAASRTFVKSSEEELRDFIIATLGTHYINKVTGETFRKIGKTDIHIVFDNKAAFVGECKIWHGIKNFEDAIEQLFGYSTWKDIKTALIIFNKENKNFASIRESVLSWIQTHTKQFEIKDGNVYICTLHRNEENIDVKLAIALYDLRA